MISCDFRFHSTTFALPLHSNHPSQLRSESLKTASPSTLIILFPTVALAPEQRWQQELFPSQQLVPLVEGSFPFKVAVHTSAAPVGWALMTGSDLKYRIYRLHDYTYNMNKHINLMYIHRIHACMFVFASGKCLQRTKNQGPHLLKERVVTIPNHWMTILWANLFTVSWIVPIPNR